MSPSQPNVLLLFTDQQRADSIRAAGNRFVRTPHLDRLAAEGTRFSSTYTPCPVCVPARGCMHYGQYPQTTDSFENSQGMPTDDRPSFMQLLTEAGYRTHGVGKVHFRPDPGALRGFQTRQSQEELFGDPEADDYLQYLRAQGYDHLTDHCGVRGEMYYIPQVAQMPARHHPTQWVGDQSIRFLENQAEQNPDQPWMLFSSYIHPHPPFAPPAPWHKLYRGITMRRAHLPPYSEQLHTWVNRLQNRYKFRDQGYDLNLLSQIIAYYHACVSFIDFQVGRILATLEKTGQLDNTLILFTSDHGELLGDYGCFGKRSFHDAASCVPMLARLPGRFAAADVCDRPSSLIDVMPTILRAAGLDVPSACQGEDLAEVAAGSSDRQVVFCQHERAGKATYMAVTEPWKYVYSAPDRREFLFDRRTDRPESRDRADIQYSRNDQQAMKSLLIDFLKDVGHTEGLDGEDFKRFEQPEIPANPDGGLLLQDQPWAEQHIPGYTD